MVVSEHQAGALMGAASAMIDRRGNGALAHRRRAGEVTLALDRRHGRPEAFDVGRHSQRTGEEAACASSPSSFSGCSGTLISHR